MGKRMKIQTAGKSNIHNKEQPLYSALYVHACTLQGIFRGKIPHRITFRDLHKDTAIKYTIGNFMHKASKISTPEFNKYIILDINQHNVMWATSDKQ